MDIVAKNLIVPDSISNDDKGGSPSSQEVRSKASPPPVAKICGRPRGRRGRVMRGGRSGYGRGVLLPGAFSTSHRFLHFARANGRRYRAAPPTTAPPLNSGGIQLHIDLLNLNDLPVADIGDEPDEGVDEEIDGVGVESNAISRENSPQSGNLAACRLLAIGRHIGVTFRCGEETMIGKFAQLEERDKREKAERAMRNNGHQ